MTDVKTLSDRIDVLETRLTFQDEIIETLNKTIIEQMKASALRRSAHEKSEAEQLAKQFDGVKLTFQRKAGERDQLFGSVTSADIANELERMGFNIDRRKIHLNEPLKTLGEYTIPIRLHREVTAPVQVVLLKEKSSSGESE